MPPLSRACYNLRCLTSRPAVHRERDGGRDFKLKQKRWGFINGWRGTEFVDFLMFLQTRSTHNYLEMLLDKKQFLRLSFESETPLNLDDCSIMEDLETKAREIFRESREKIRRFLDGGL